MPGWECMARLSQHICGQEQQGPRVHAIHQGHIEHGDWNATATATATTAAAAPTATTTALVHAVCFSLYALVHAACFNLNSTSGASEYPMF